MYLLESKDRFFWFACALWPLFSYVTFEISMTFYYLSDCVRETRMREDLCVHNDVCMNEAEMCDALRLRDVHMSAV